MNHTSNCFPNGGSKWIWCQKICQSCEIVLFPNFYINMTFSGLRFCYRIDNIAVDDDDRFNVFIILNGADVRGKTVNLCTNKMFIITGVIRGNQMSKTNNVNRKWNQRIGTLFKTKMKQYGIRISILLMESGSQIFCSASIQLNGNRKSKFNRPTARWMTLFGSILVLIRSLFSFSAFVSSWFNVRLFNRIGFNWINYFRWNRKSRKVFKRNLIWFLSVSNKELESMGQ